MDNYSKGKILTEGFYNDEPTCYRNRNRDKKVVKEVYDPSIPDWAIDAIRSGNRDKQRSNSVRDIAWDKAKFIGDTIPSSNRDPRLKDTSKVHFMKFDDGDSVAFRGDKSWTVGINNPYIGKFWKSKQFTDTPWKDILPHVTEYGYVDVMDSDNSTVDLMDQRRSAKDGSDIDQYSSNYRGQGQFKEYDQEWVPSYYDEKGDYHSSEYKTLDTYKWFTDAGYDKSGYRKLNLDQLAKKLAMVDGGEKLLKKVSSYCNQLEDIRSKLAYFINNVDITKYNRYSVSDTNFSKALDAFRSAVGSYQRFKSQLDKAVDKYNNGTYNTNGTYNDDLSFYTLNDLRDNIKKANECINNL